MNLIEDKIKEQQDVAKEVVALLEEQFGNAVVAGGAARDWYMGTYARDIDVYVNVDPKKAAILYAMATIALGEEVKPLGERYEELEQSEIGFLCVGTIWYNCVECNVIFLNKHCIQGEVYSHFDCDICKIMWNSSEGFITTEEFDTALQTKTITFDHYSPKHFAKMVDKFASWSFKFNSPVADIANNIIPLPTLMEMNK